MIRVVGQVDEQHRLSVELPASVPPGPVHVLVLPATGDEDEAGDAWMAGVALEWHAELSDPREDLYSITDGEPVDEAG